MPVLEQVKLQLDKGLPARTLSFTKEQQEILRSLHFLTLKPTLYIAEGR